MVKLLKDFKSWEKENRNFYELLKSHDSVLYTRFYPVYEVLNHLYEDYAQVEVLNEDVEKIMQVGLEYLHHQINTCKIYYEKMFDSKFDVFIHYDRVINYLLFIEDLKYELAEHQVSYDKNSLENIIDELESYISEKAKVPNNINMIIDSKLNRIIDLNKQEFHSINDIFVEIASTLGLTLDQSEDYILGDDL